MQHDLLAKVTAALDTAGVPYMVTGSFASSFHGEPRMTQDIDLVVDPDVTTIALFVEQFDPSRFYIDDAVAATMRRDMFNIVEVKTGWKVDLIIRKDRPFSAEEFRRRIPGLVSGVPAFVASAEDTILSKLEWSKASGSERQVRDVVAILQVQRSTLDFPYLERWAAELGVADQLGNAVAISET